MAKKIHHIANLSQLNPGDILLFRPTGNNTSKLQKWVEGGIGFLQALVQQKHGHYDTSHAAICVSNKGGIPIIAHMIGKGFRREPLKTMLERDGGERPFLVYRPNDTTVSQKIAEVAGDDLLLFRNMRWKLFSACSSFIRISKLNPKREIPTAKPVEAYTHCSKFVTQIIKRSVVNLQKERKTNRYRNYYPNIRSIGTPKALEAYLYQQNNFTLHCFTGFSDPYIQVKDFIHDQLEILMQHSHNDKMSRKYLLAKETFETFERNHSLNLNSFAKALGLLRQILPILEVNTNLGIKPANSYKAVLNYARGIGIFERHIKNQHYQSNYQKAQHFILPSQSL